MYTKVVLATDMSLDFGFSKALLLRWASGKANTILLTGRGHGDSTANDLLIHKKQMEDRIIDAATPLIVSVRVRLITVELMGGAEMGGGNSCSLYVFFLQRSLPSVSYKFALMDEYIFASVFEGGSVVVCLVRHRYSPTNAHVLVFPRSVEGVALLLRVPLLEMRQVKPNRYSRIDYKADRVLIYIFKISPAIYSWFSDDYTSMPTVVPFKILW